MHPGYSLQTKIFLGYLVQMHVLRYSQTDLRLQLPPGSI